MKHSQSTRKRAAIRTADDRLDGNNSRHTWGLRVLNSLYL